MSSPSLAPDPLIDALLSARLHDPFRLLGLHHTPEGWRLRVFQPQADAVWLRLPTGVAPLERVHRAGVFEWRGPQPPAAPYVLGVSEGGRSARAARPLRFRAGIERA